MAGLDALLYLQRLMAPGRRPGNPEMVENQPPSPLAGLPDAVLASIMQNPSYAEGKIIPNAQPHWTDIDSFAPEVAQQQRGLRERERLSRELNFLRGYNAQQNPLKEGRAPSAAPDPYSPPYNLGLGNLGALY